MNFMNGCVLVVVTATDHMPSTGGHNLLAIPPKHTDLCRLAAQTKVLKLQLEKIEWRNALALLQFPEQYGYVHDSCVSH